MDEKRRIGSLVKFFEEKEWADSFRRGQLRLGQVAAFRKKYSEDGGRRHDPAEFADIHSEFLNARIFIGGTDIEVGQGAGRIDGRRDLDRQAYIFCMTAVTDAHLYDSGMHHIPDPKLIELGGYAVIVTDYPEFVKRTYSAICSLGYLQGHPDLRGSFLGLIEYVDFRTYRGYLGPFRKSSEYAFQDEWRMALIDGREHVEAADHLIMDVGDLSDITMPVDASHLLKVGFRGEERCAHVPQSRNAE